MNFALLARAWVHFPITVLGLFSKPYLIEDAKIEPMISLVTTDNWMEFTLRYVVDYKARRVKKDQLFTRTLDEFLDTNGRVEFASATFQLVEALVFNVRLTDGKQDSLPQSFDDRS